MESDGGSTDGGPVDESRRRYLAALTVVASGVLAGCEESPSPDRSFEADPVSLPDAALEDLSLEEMSRESLSTDRTDGEDSIRITSQAATYRRAAGGGD